MKKKSRKKKKTPQKRVYKTKSGKTKKKLTFSSILGFLLGILMIVVGFYGAISQSNPIGYLFVFFGAVVSGFIVWYVFVPKGK